MMIGDKDDYASFPDLTPLTEEERRLRRRERLEWWKDTGMAVLGGAYIVGFWGLVYWLVFG